MAIQFSRRTSKWAIDNHGLTQIFPGQLLTVYTHQLARAACVHCQRTKCPLLTVFLPSNKPKPKLFEASLNGRRPQLFKKWRHTHFFEKWKTNSMFSKMEDTPNIFKNRRWPYFLRKEDNPNFLKTTDNLILKLKCNVNQIFQKWMKTSIICKWKMTCIFLQRGYLSKANKGWLSSSKFFLCYDLFSSIYLDGHHSDWKV